MSRSLVSMYRTCREYLYSWRWTSNRCRIDLYHRHASIIVDIEKVSHIIHVESTIDRWRLHKSNWLQLVMVSRNVEDINYTSDTTFTHHMHQHEQSTIHLFDKIRYMKSHMSLARSKTVSNVLLPQKLHSNPIRWSGENNMLHCLHLMPSAFELLARPVDHT